MLKQTGADKKKSKQIIMLDQSHDGSTLLQIQSKGKGKQSNLKERNKTFMP